jgi:hypothetical protein
MIWHFNPYALDKKYLDAIDSHFNLVTNPDDWVVIKDGDTAYLRSDWGEVIKRYTDLYPDTGLFTCYASRCHYQCQVPAFVNMESDSILYHHRMADQVSQKYKGAVKEIERKIAGHLWAMRRSTWTLIREEVYRTAADKHILGIDTKVSYAVLNAGLKIRLMRELYIFHYLRMAEGFEYKGHLK